MQLLI